nr:PREDICTED: cadherin-1-like [Latimeria chalumnae]|eukprot:XP_006014203.2 PREDICTED: cadherin-1-like [Latimeria chalumnae]
MKCLAGLFHLGMALIFLQHEASAVVQTDKSVLAFRRSNSALKRQKRCQMFPHVVENGRGPFPAYVLQVRSSRDKEVTVYYSITGPGADQYPEGLFTIDRKTGKVFVTKPLDREKQKEYRVSFCFLYFD